ncbi:MAG: IS66 family insertion sequence element accessory protein TnpB [Proteobacteria bacterium]|nr:IS66 family insertion sequence element accessory protein TnpB [Pseudomonadota bacterium]
MFAYAAPVDMRKSWEGLGAIVRNDLGQDLLEGSFYLFVNRRRNRSKVLFFDGTGLCIFMKRLERNQFAKLWRQTESKTLSLTMSEMQLFLEGSEMVGKITLVPRKISSKSLEISNQL